MTNDSVRIRFTTELGELAFQEYFVRERLQPRLRAIDFAGGATARPSVEVATALAAADLVIIGPSNPLISIAPILLLTRQLLRRGHPPPADPPRRGGAPPGGPPPAGSAGRPPPPRGPGGGG